ncbi:tetratricopeptide repeat protein [Microcoleus sp. FACHB-1515]|uniref:tetratricopeptide repeat protein n=1 Tax=Cyanophyceae TaxID=3028117 RepID=UPI001688A161|nr:tetratricopeptide repeat protein [Microcoleus sp. FACHB-1515]MBD2089338.1 tetratricopeptide repeat protein [Microcoleus sp. FACHB-1515]
MTVIWERSPVLFDKRNRWLINSVLIVAVLAFIGVAIYPAVEAWRESSRTPTATSSPAARQAELETQARGYELALEREPNNQTLLRGLVDTRIEMGDLKGAIDPIKKLAELNPTDSSYTILLAQVLLRSGDREGAAQAYREILSKRPGDIGALQGFVELQLQQDRPEAAVGLLQDTLRSADAANKAQPGSIDVTSVRLLLGRVYATQERDAEAIAVYDEAIKGDAEDFRPVLAKALVLQAQNKNEEARSLFNQAEALAPAQYKDQIQQLAQGQPSPTASPSPGTAPEAAPTTPSSPAASPSAAESPQPAATAPAEP